MNLSIISFTQNGISLSKNIANVMEQIKCSLYTKCSTDYISDNNNENIIKYVEQSIYEWTGKQFEEKNAILFIGATGIAVRAIAPHINDKLTDSPVLVMDEMGKYIIPVLSGHVGGANEIALNIATLTGAKPVITTATDINGLFAIDIFAKKNQLFITNKDGIAKVSSKILSEKSISISIENDHLDSDDYVPSFINIIDYPPQEKTDVVITSEDNKFDTSLLLKPMEYVIGFGCKKGKEYYKIDQYINESLEQAGISLNSISGISSIDVKKDEPGLIKWSTKTRIPFTTYSAEELESVGGTFNSSEFVKANVGVDNVCERAALKLCGADGKLIYEKHAKDGMTIAIAKKTWRVKFDE